MMKKIMIVGLALGAASLATGLDAAAQAEMKQKKAEHPAIVMADHARSLGKILSVQARFGSKGLEVTAGSRSGQVACWSPEKSHILQDRVFAQRADNGQNRQHCVITAGQYQGRPFVVVGTARGKLRVQCPDTGQQHYEEQNLGFAEPISALSSCVLTTDGGAAYLAAASGKRVAAFGVHSGCKMGEHTAHQARVTAVDMYDQDGSYCVVSGDTAGRICFWDFAHQNIKVKRTPHDNSITALRCRVDEGDPCMIAGTRNGDLVIFDEDKTFAVYPHPQEPVIFVSLAAHKSQLVCVSHHDSSNTLRVRDLETGEVVQTITYSRSAGSPNAVMTATDLAQDQHGNVWLVGGTFGGVLFAHPLLEEGKENCTIELPAMPKAAADHCVIL